MKKLLTTTVVLAILTTQLAPSYAGEIWWATARYPDTGCVTADQKKDFFNTPAGAFANMQGYAKKHSMTPILQDHGDWIGVGVRTKYDDLISYVYYRSKEVCEQAAAEADEIVKSIFGAAAKEYREMHPDLN